MIGQVHHLEDHEVAQPKKGMSCQPVSPGIVKHEMIDERPHILIYPIPPVFGSSKRVFNRQPDSPPNDTPNDHVPVLTAEGSWSFGMSFGGESGCLLKTRLL